MKKIFITILFFCSIQINAQQFITSGSIEFEVKTNTYRQNEGNEWFERFKDQIDQFDVNYYSYAFANNTSVYKFNRKGSTKSSPFFNSRDDETIWYNDYTLSEQTKLLSLDGYLLMSGAQRKMSWKLEPEDQREIAGFKCRKAQTILFDSVYVFVYYTDEIKISGGPMGLHGLPGMILGVTIPRLYTSWIATSVKLTSPDTKTIVKPTKGKTKTDAEIKKSIEQLNTSWGSDSKKWLDLLMWRALL
jgi:GLPGLI family protein